MSLKGFHIIFIALAFLCTAGFAAWTWVEVEAAQKAGAQALGNASGLLSIVLFIYGVWFAVRKARTIII